jgi:hypothetical protein
MWACFCNKNNGDTKKCGQIDRAQGGVMEKMAPK